MKMIILISLSVLLQSCASMNHNTIAFAEIDLVKEEICASEYMVLGSYSRGSSFASSGTSWAAGSSKNYSCVAPITKYDRCIIEGYRYSLDIMAKLDLAVRAQRPYLQRKFSITEKEKEFEALYLKTMKQVRHHRGIVKSVCFKKLN